MSKALAKMFEPMFAGLAKRYQGWVGAELSKYGLRYDDLLDETMNLDVAEALGVSLRRSATCGCSA